MERRPSVAECRMLQNAAKLTYGAQGMREQSAVIADLVPVAFLVDVRQLGPAAALRMRHHWPWARILSRVPCLIPRINPRHIPVAPAALHVQRRNHPRTSRTSMPWQASMSFLVRAHSRGRPPLKSSTISTQSETSWGSELAHRSW